MSAEQVRPGTITLTRVWISQISETPPSFSSMEIFSEIRISRVNKPCYKNKQKVRSSWCLKPFIISLSGLGLWDGWKQNSLSTATGFCWTWLMRHDHILVPNPRITRKAMSTLTKYYVLLTTATGNFYITNKRYVEVVVIAITMTRTELKVPVFSQWAAPVFFITDCGARYSVRRKQGDKTVTSNGRTQEHRMLCGRSTRWPKYYWLNHLRVMLFVLSLVLGNQRSTYKIKHRSFFF